MIFVLRPGRPPESFEAVITRKDLRSLVAAFRGPFERPLDRRGRFAGRFDAESGAKLYELLIKPAFPLLAKDSKLIIVPDGALGLLSFEALVGTPAGDVKASRFLADDYDIGYAQSATALTLARTLRKGGSAAKGFFVLADPIFDALDPRAQGADLSSAAAKGVQDQVAGAVIRQMGVGDGFHFPRLEETGALARSLKKTFGEEAVAAVGRDASESRLKRENLGKYRYLALATHGILDTDVPYIREPALVLSQVGNAKDEDGFLTMSKVMGSKLDAEVVALTACKTGLGKEESGEGVMGLGRAFQYAGARNVLVSLWSVAEKSTTLLGDGFFKHMKDGKTPREALRAARAEVRAAGYDHPFFWAPFILMGE